MQLILLHFFVEVISIALSSISGLIKQTSMVNFEIVYVCSIIVSLDLITHYVIIFCC